MHTVNTESLGGVHSKEIIRNTKKCISRDFTMVLFKKRKGESVLRVKIDLILERLYSLILPPPLGTHFTEPLPAPSLQ